MCQQVLLETDPVLQRQVDAPEVDVCNKDTVWLKAGIQGKQILKCAHKEQSADQQDQGKRDLRNHQQTTQAEPLTRACSAAAACLHGGFGGRLPFSCGPPQSKKQTKEGNPAPRQTNHPPTNNLSPKTPP